MIVKLLLVTMKEILPAYAAVVAHTARKCRCGREAPSGYPAQLLKGSYKCEMPRHVAKDEEPTTRQKQYHNKLLAIDPVPYPRM
jgi:hypothetical protein